MLQKILSPLEQEVMNIVWECEDCSVRDVLAKLDKEKRLAYTTVATILQRLFEKGLVRRKNEGLVVHYSPKISKTDYGKTLAQSFVSKFIKSFGDSAIASFAESIEKLPRAKKDYFLKLLSKKHEIK